MSLNDESTLEAYFKLDDGSGTAPADSSGNARTGTFINTPTWGTGRLGGGLTLNGSSQAFTCPAIDEIDAVAGVTVACWANLASLGDFRMFISRFTNNNSRIELCLSGAGAGSNNDLQFALANTAATDGYTTGNIVPTSTWFHVAGVFDGSQADNATRLKIYFNGVQQSLTFTGTIPATTSTQTGVVTNIGRRGNGTLFQAGTLDEVRIYSRALSQAEIRSLISYANRVVVKSQNLI